MATTNSQSRAAAQKRRRQKALEVGRAVRFGRPEAETVARQELAALQIEQYIERALKKAPPLSASQIRILSGLLRGRSA